MEKQQKNQSRLIDLVDKEFQQKLRKIYLSTNLNQRFYSKFFLMGFFLVVYLIAAIIISKVIQAVPFTFDSSTPIQSLTLMLSITTAFVALMSFSFGTMFNLKPENLCEIQKDYNYNVLKRKVNDQDLPKLKALIILKSKNPDFLLSKRYSKDDDLTTEEVFRILYDNPATNY